MMRHLSTAIFLPLLISCAQSRVGDTGIILPPFCNDLQDADTWRFEGQGGGATTGAIEGKLVTSAGTSFNDPNYVADISFTLENLDIGGTTQHHGVTRSNGTFSHTGGAGTWEFKAGASVGGRPCSANMTFDVEAGRISAICPMLSCE